MTIFDDNAEIGEDNIGIAKFNLFSLFETDNFGGSVAIKDLNDDVVGQLHVKFYWKDTISKRKR